MYQGNGEKKACNIVINRLDSFNMKGRGIK